MTVFFEDEAAVLISSGALESTGLQIDKTGDTQNLEEALSYGLNAAVHVRDAGSATLTDALAHDQTVWVQQACSAPATVPPPS